MLTEQFIASVGVANKAPSTNVFKDATISVHEFQPLLQQTSIYKKSATLQNCLAIGSTHIFAAQADKGVVFVYSTERGNQEATVPFPERITCIALACDDAVLVLGTGEGRIFLWELASGRQITTSQAHLQSVTVLTVDPTSNFLLSASADSIVHVWSLPALLSFATVDVQALSPLQSFTNHSAEVCALVTGHSSSSCNIAVSASKDKTCLVWDYYTANLLRTYLLPETPTSLVLDSADRYVYIGYDDGSVQQLDLYDVRNSKDPIAPTQPSRASRWRVADASAGSVLSLSVSFDGCTILTGHESGFITAWDASKGSFKFNVLQTPLPGPVSNLSFLPLTGFPDMPQGAFSIPAVVKPKFGAFDNPDGEIPTSYTIHMGWQSRLGTSSVSAFEEALYAPTFPQSMLDEGLAELASWGKQNHPVEEEDTADFMALDDEPNGPRKLTLEEQNLQLKKEIEALRRVQRVSFEKMDRMNAQSKRQERTGALNGAREMNASSDED